LVNIRFLHNQLNCFGTQSYYVLRGLKRGFLAAGIVCLLHAGTDDRLVVSGPSGRLGGRLVAAQRSEPKTLNWVVADDGGSREILTRLMADLIHINRESLQVEPALAKSWKASNDNLHWTLHLREGVQFSDGHPFDADDVVFTFQVLLDENVHSAQRDLLMVGDKPIGVRKVDAHTVVFDFPGPYSVPERLFDGVWILPRHKLEAAWKAGRLGEAWGLRTPPAEIAGLGPFRFREYVPGQRITLERNPHYWKRDSNGTQLPYLAEVTFLFVGSEDAQVMRFQAGESDLINRVGGRNFAVLAKEQDRRGYEMRSAGPGLEYSFLVFNLVPGRAGFLGRRSFRQAVSAAVDREALARIAYGGRAVPIAVPVPAGNKLWVNSAIPVPTRSAERARKILSDDGFKWRDGVLLDPTGKPVTFSIVAANNNPERLQMAGLIQDDLKQIGIKAEITPLEIRSLLEKVQGTHDFDAALMAFGAADTDPNPDMPIWLSSGGNHLWNPKQPQPATPWEAEIDRLMRQQIVTHDYAKRKRMFDRVQEILAEQQPMVALVTPFVLVGARKDLANFRPAVLEPTILWNIEQLYWRSPQSGAPK
jgi:peptide/nickel transport system substrate-binding protein